MTSEQRKEAEERERWAKAEERAKGGKVADQEGTLKRAVKRLEKKKSKSGKEWCVLRFPSIRLSTFPPGSLSWLSALAVSKPHIVTPPQTMRRCQAMPCGGRQRNPWHS